MAASNFLKNTVSVEGCSNFLGNKGTLCPEKNCSMPKDAVTYNKKSFFRNN